jgi:DNA-binding transcriptional LysR family regulator
VRGLDLNHVATFVAVVDSRGFSRAAKSLGVPTSSVSRAVARLEEQLGARLLQRTTRAISLTEAGRLFHEEASRSIRAVDEVAFSLSSRRAGPSGIVRITAPPNVVYSVLADVTADFIREYPRVHIELRVTPRYVDLISEGVDLAVRFGPLVDSSLIARKIGRFALGLYASTEYLKRHGRPKVLGDLTAHACILSREGGVGRDRWTFDSPRGQETVEVKGPIAAPSTLIANRLAIAGVGIALLTRGMFEDPNRELVHVLPEHSVGGESHLVMPSSRHVAPSVALFRDVIVGRLRARLAAS